MLKKITPLLFTLVIAFTSVSAVYVHAQSQPDQAIGEKKEATNLDKAGYTPQIFNADVRLKAGTVIQVDEKDATKVASATQDKIEKAFGVVVTANNSPIRITNNANANQVFVSTNGNQQVMITNENGPVKAGDSLALSSLSGTLMKSTTKQKIVFGKALANFDGKNNTIGTTTLKDTKGNAHKQIGIGIIPVSIEIIANPEIESTEANLPEQLQRLGQQIAEKPVSQIRIYISMAIVTISIIIALVLLYSGVKNAIISIGRNPLSKKSIFRALLEVILTSVIVLIIGLFSVYLLLRL